MRESVPPHAAAPVPFRQFGLRQLLAFTMGGLGLAATLATALVLALVPDMAMPPRDEATLPAPVAPATGNPAGAATSAIGSARIRIEPGPAWHGTFLS